MRSFGSVVCALQVALFEGLCYTTPIIGALLADSLWGRYKTILVFSLIYLVVSPWALARVPAAVACAHALSCRTCNMHVDVGTQGIIMLAASTMIPDAAEDAETANPLQVCAAEQQIRSSP